MNTSFKALGTLVLVLFGTLASAAAMAQHRAHGHGGGVRFGISLGVPLYGPGYYRAPYHAYPFPYPVYTYPAPIYTYPAPVYAYPAPAIATSSPPVYVERSAAAQAGPSQAQADWYYCAASSAYYPQVAQCPAGWQRVPAQPPPGVAR